MGFAAGKRAAGGGGGPKTEEGRMPPWELTQVAYTREKDPWNPRTRELWGCGDGSHLPGTTAPFHAGSF